MSVHKTGLRCREIHFTCVMIVTSFSGYVVGDRRKDFHLLTVILLD
jgi:hypothetical protein